MYPSFLTASDPIPSLEKVVQYWREIGCQEEGPGQLVPVAGGWQADCCAGTTQELSNCPKTSGRKLCTSDYLQCTVLKSPGGRMRRFNLSQSSLNTVAKRYSSDMAQNYVKRVTLFKVPKPEHIDEARTNEEV